MFASSGALIQVFAFKRNAEEWIQRVALDSLRSDKLRIGILTESTPSASAELKALRRVVRAAQAWKHCKENGSDRDTDGNLWRSVVNYELALSKRKERK